MAKVPKTSGQGVSRLAYKTAHKLGNKGASSGGGEKFKKLAKPAKGKAAKVKKPKNGLTLPISKPIGDLSDFEDLK